MDGALLASGSVLVLFALILLGVHIGVALALVSFLSVLGLTGRFDIAVNLMGATAYSAVMDYVFAVIPLFVLMGLFANHSGATRNLFTAAEALLGRLPGGVGIATVAANAVFAAITGVSVASAAVFSRIAIPEMRRFHYAKTFSLGIVAASAILGMLIPPSILMIVYGVLTEQSIGKLFVAGVIPGLLIALILSAGIAGMVILRPALGGGHVAIPPLTARQRIRLLLRPWGAFVLIGLVLGGIYGGFFTPTEAGAVGAAGALILMLVKAEAPLRRLPAVLTQAGQTTTSIFLLLIGAQMYSKMLALSGLPTLFTGWIVALELPGTVVVLAFVGVILLLGMILDSVSIILLTVPMMTPVVHAFGYDPLWFGLVLIVAVEIGLLTPPFGMVVFTIKATLGDEVTLQEIFTGALPFVVLLLLGLGLLIAFPPLITWLPAQM